MNPQGTGVGLGKSAPNGAARFPRGPPAAGFLPVEKARTAQANINLACRHERLPGICQTNIDCSFCCEEGSKCIRIEAIETVIKIVGKRDGGS